MNHSLNNSLGLNNREVDLFSRVIPAPEKLGNILKEEHHHEFSRYERGFSALSALADRDESALRIMKAASVGFLNKLNEAVWKLCYRVEDFDELLPAFPFESVTSIREQIMGICGKLQLSTNDEVLNQERNFALLAQELRDLLKLHEDLFKSGSGVIEQLEKSIPAYCSDNLDEMLSCDENPLMLCHDIERYVRALTESKVSSDLTLSPEIRSSLVWRDGDMRNLKNGSLLRLLSQLRLHQVELRETLESASQTLSSVPTQKLDRFHEDVMEVVEMYLLRHQESKSRFA